MAAPVYRPAHADLRRQHTGRSLLVIRLAAGGPGASNGWCALAKQLFEDLDG
ncbi:hypothetical protein [Mesorhizobium escarrei]|uniref:hypothetical protein n=1 Tax=Mesorhizobium escarrei TaxID=666018 RepID=UPI0020A778B0|nr:hypothetical protein [Mesorhizobium escarrei]